MVSYAAVLALSVPSMLLLVGIAVVLVGVIAWLLPRPDASLSVRRVGSDELERPGL